MARQKNIENKKAIVTFLAANGKCKAAEIGDHIGLSSACTKTLVLLGASTVVEDAVHIFRIGSQ